MKQRKRKEFYYTGIEISDPVSLRGKRTKPQRKGRTPQTELTSEVLEKRIAESLHNQIKDLTDIPFNFRKAQIVNAQVLRDHLEISVRLPFWLPLPTNNLGDWLGTPRAVKQFRQGFLKHLSSKKDFPRLSNLFFEEYVAFIYSFIGAYKFGEHIVERIQPVGERHNAGRPRQFIEEIDEIYILKECKTVLVALKDIKQQIRKWKARAPSLGDRKCEEWIRQQYPKDRFPWISFFLRLIQKIPSRTDRKGDILHGKLSNASSWSAPELAIQVVQETYYRKTGIRFPARKVRERLNSSPS